MCVELHGLLASSLFLLLLPYLFWSIVIYGFYHAALLVADEYKAKRYALEEPRRRFLEESFPYYRQLQAADRKTFEKRLKAFLREKEVVAIGAQHMPDDTKLLVAALATQLTLGFPPVYLTHFRKVVLLPEEIPSVHPQGHPTGEAQAGDVLMLPWKLRTLESSLPDNLGNAVLREMAPALLLGKRLQTPEYSFLSEEVIEGFFACAAQEYNSILVGAGFPLQSGILIGQKEFFGAAVEVFFERPREFRTGFPQLYEALAQLLNQNPLEKRPMAFVES